MKTKIILTLILLGAGSLGFAQRNFITDNVQEELQNKLWSSDPESNMKVMFQFKSEGTLHLYTAGNEVGFEDFYVTTEDCRDSRVEFDLAKVGTSSSGNYIKTQAFCYKIEFYSGFQKFRIKPSAAADSQWQTFYLLE